MKTKKRLKPFVVPMLYGVCTITLLVSLMFLIQTLTDINSSPITYITSSTIVDDAVPVISEKKTIIRPYTDNDVTILQNYYDYKADKEIQENSLIYYEGTYLQNSGIDYGKENVFDIVSILDGTVINVEEDDILGKIIEIQYTNELIASFQCLGEGIVKNGDTVMQGEKIGTSGTCNISKNIGNHLHLEISNKGEIINPENIYDKSIDEI